MIIDKHKPIRPSAPKEIPVVPDHESDEVQEVVETNAMVEAYKAVRKILESIPKDSKDPNSPHCSKLSSWIMDS